MVAERGFEPPRACAHASLSRARLPATPLGHIWWAGTESNRLSPEGNWFTASRRAVRHYLPTLTYRNALSGAFLSKLVRTPGLEPGSTWLSTKQVCQFPSRAHISKIWSDRPDSNRHAHSGAATFKVAASTRSATVGWCAREDSNLYGIEPAGFEPAASAIPPRARIQFWRKAPESNRVPTMRRPFSRRFRPMPLPSADICCAKLRMMALYLESARGECSSRNRAD